jgi:AraC family transcriptional regulator
MAHIERRLVSRSAEQASAPPAPRSALRGRGWSVSEFVCTLGPHDRPYEEQHELVAISAVVEGSFQYRSANGKALLYPGALLLGNAGRCFECGHEHARGDRCIAFHFEPWFFEEIAASATGSHRFRFGAPMLPAARPLGSLVVEAETVLAGVDTQAMEDLAVSLAERVIATASGTIRTSPALAAKDARRIDEVIRHIEAHAGQSLDLDALANRVYMSKYHFLRVFRRVTGVTPHQFILSARLRRAAIALRRTSAPVGVAALDAGFGDLSSFNAHFRRMFGRSPSVFRGARRHDFAAIGRRDRIRNE